VIYVLHIRFGILESFGFGVEGFGFHKCGLSPACFLKEGMKVYVFEPPGVGGLRAQGLRV
jgi:hypothetical protein